MSHFRNVKTLSDCLKENILLSNFPFYDILVVNYWICIQFSVLLSWALLKYEFLLFGFKKSIWMYACEIISKVKFKLFKNKKYWVSFTKLIYLILVYLVQFKLFYSFSVISGFKWKKKKRNTVSKRGNWSLNQKKKKNQLKRPDDYLASYSGCFPLSESRIIIQ